MTPIRIGLVGYGTGGRLFHAPYIAASDHCTLAGVVTANPVRAAEASRETGAVIFGSTQELVAHGIDALVVSTPLGARSDVVDLAIEAGIDLVIDKPLATSAAEAEQLAVRSEAVGILIDVFHNRRFDTDIMTALKVVRNDDLGDLIRLDLRCDQNAPGLMEPGENTGLLWDLGSHLVDQAVQLLGPVADVTATLDRSATPGGRAISGFVLMARHISGAHSHLSATKLAHIESRELRLIGVRGTYVSDFTDVQYEAIINGRRPADDRSGWGYERPERWGRLSTADGVASVPSEQGDYALFYDQFAAAVRDRSPGPASARYGATVLRVLEAAIASDRDRRIVVVGT